MQPHKDFKADSCYHFSSKVTLWKARNYHFYYKGFSRWPNGPQGDCAFETFVSRVEDLFSRAMPQDCVLVRALINLYFLQHRVEVRGRPICVAPRWNQASGSLAPRWKSDGTVVVDCFLQRDEHIFLQFSHPAHLHQHEIDVQIRSKEVFTLCGIESLWQ